MIRILRLSTNRDLTPAEAAQSIEAAQEAAEAAAKVRGVKSSKLCLSNGNLVFVSESQSYGVADTALKDAGVQAAFGRLGAEFGYRPIGDEFLLDIDQLMPFVRR